MKFALVGCGKMGTALVSGAINKDALDSSSLLLCDSYSPAAEALQSRIGGQVSSLEDVANQADTILLCTKPGDVPNILSILAEEPHPRLIISVAAGVTLSTLTKHSQPSSRVIRCMPNTPALVGAGAAAYSPCVTATPEDIVFAERLLGSVGVVRKVSEKLMDAVTGLSGSGPAYVYLIIEALADGGVKNGLNRDDALTLATQTVLGAAQMVAQTGEHPAKLKDNVTSPGGTTIAGLSALEKGKLRSTLIDSIDAATARSIELGKN